MIENLIKGLQEEFPEDTFDITHIDTSNKYKIIQTVMNDLIGFRNIISGGSFGELSEEEVLSNLIETVVLQKNIYIKLDRNLIIKERKTIKYLDQADPVSLHKLTEDELEKKIKEYEITKDELKKVIV